MFKVLLETFVGIKKIYLKLLVAFACFFTLSKSEGVPTSKSILLSKLKSSEELNTAESANPQYYGYGYSGYGGYGYPLYGGYGGYGHLGHYGHHHGHGHHYHHHHHHGYSSDSDSD